MPGSSTGVSDDTKENENTDIVEYFHRTGVGHAVHGGHTDCQCKWSLFGWDANPYSFRDPTPTPAGGATTIFYNLLFPSKMISDALGKVFMDAADAQSHQLVEQYAQWYQVIGDIMQAPQAGDYSRFARSSWPVAAALAPALFILRIALYQWNRLIGEEDGAARAAGDILTALVMAVLCGWLLDLVVRLGYWMAGAAVGESGDMAISFIKSMSVDGIIQNLANGTATLSFIFGIFLHCGRFGSIAGRGWHADRFRRCQCRSIPPGGAWTVHCGHKCDSTNALVTVPMAQSSYGDSHIALGGRGVFKASVYMANIFTPGGILALIIHVIWLWVRPGQCCPWPEYWVN